MIRIPDIAFLLTALGIMGIYAGFSGQIVIGVAGGILTAVGLASLAAFPVHWIAAVGLLSGSRWPEREVELLESLR